MKASLLQEREKFQQISYTQIIRVLPWRLIKFTYYFSLTKFLIHAMNASCYKYFITSIYLNLKLSEVIVNKKI
jgi:hypothetical protein